MWCFTTLKFQIDKHFVCAFVESASGPLLTPHTLCVNNNGRHGVTVRMLCRIHQGGNVGRARIAVCDIKLNPIDDPQRKFSIGSNKKKCHLQLSFDLPC
jgi:hypothetical protein